MKTVVALLGQAEDERDVCDRLRKDGYEVSGYLPSPDDAALRDADVVVIDQPQTGSLLESPWLTLADICREKPVLCFAPADATRVTARRWGAYYVGETPRTVSDIALLIGRARAAGHLTRPSLSRQMMIGEGRAMLKLRRVLQTLAVTPSVDVLLQGEPGSGRRTFARALHLESRLGGVFLETTDPKVIDATIHCGRPTTVYLGDLSRVTATQQGRLFRGLGMLRDVSAPTRFVAALTESSAKKAALGGAHLLPSLLARFHATVHVPPLRERLEDLPLLAVCLLGRAARLQRVRAPKLSADAVSALKADHWCGNVRQLEDTLTQALQLAHNGIVEACHLTLDAEVHRSPFRLPPEGVNLLELEREVLLQALRLAHGNRTRAAALLGLTRDQVRYRLSKLDVETNGGEGTRVA